MKLLLAACLATMPAWAALQPADRPQPAAGAAAASVAPPRQLHYELRGSTYGVELTGEGRLNWQHDGQRYQADLELRIPLLRTRTQRSTGRLTPQGLQPERFSDRRRKEETVRLDHARGALVFGDGREETGLAEGAQDRLSVLLQLGAVLAARPGEPRIGDTFSFEVVGTQDAEPWHFTVQGHEELKLPGGTLRTVRLTREPRKQADQRVELWLAPGRDYAPVRLRLTSPRGEWLDQQWSGTDRP